MRISELKFYSIGIVAANKPRDSKFIEVSPIEATSQAQGEITDNMDTVSLKGIDDDGSSFETKANTAASVKAQWLPLGQANRVTAPDVRRGEEVILLEFADTNEYWWITSKNTDSLRKLETVILAFSATTKEDEKATAENTYFLEISTHDKRIHFHTSMANGEPFAYDFLLDTNEGVFQLTDDIKNIIFLNSREKQIALVNADNSFIEINKKNIILNAVEHISLKAGKTISLEAPDKIYSSTNLFNVDTKLFKIESPKSTFSGEVTIAKNTFIAGGLGVGSPPGSDGTATIANDLNITGFLRSSKGSTWGGVVTAKDFIEN